MQYSRNTESLQLLWSQLRSMEFPWPNLKKIMEFLWVLLLALLLQLISHHPPMDLQPMSLLRVMECQMLLSLRTMVFPAPLRWIMVCPLHQW